MRVSGDSLGEETTGLGEDVGWSSFDEATFREDDDAIAAAKD